MPKKLLPTSPKKITDLGKLKNKNPKTEAETLIRIKVRLKSERIKYAKKENTRKTNIASIEAKPSIPSIKLYRFINQTIYIDPTR